jgi:dephospho-CoA kinase
MKLVKMIIAFIGNNGTGKTTIAKEMEKGYLS